VEPVKLTMRYCGKDVEDGTMSLEDIVPALQGLLSAYEKVQKQKGIKNKHVLRITQVRKGSFELWITAYEIASEIGTLENVGGGAGAIIVIVISIMRVIELFKHTKKESYQVKIKGDNNTVIVINKEQNEYETTPDVLEMFSSGIIKNELEKIVQPLEEGKIDSAKIIAEESDGNIHEEIVTYKDKPFFQIEGVEVTETKEAWLSGIMLSLSKSTNNGKFILGDGDKVLYHLSMMNPEEHYHYFTHKGAVKVKCIVHLDESLKPIKIDVYEIQKIQADLFNGDDNKQ